MRISSLLSPLEYFPTTEVAIITLTVWVISEIATPRSLAFSLSGTTSISGLLPI